MQYLANSVNHAGGRSARWNLCSCWLLCSCSSLALTAANLAHPACTGADAFLDGSQKLQPMKAFTLLRIRQSTDDTPLPTLAPEVKAHLCAIVQLPP